MLEVTVRAQKLIIETKQQIPYSKGITWPGLLFGVIASISLVLGLVPPYFELWKRSGRVIGISKWLAPCVGKLGNQKNMNEALAKSRFLDWVFLGMDALGALFSTFALGNFLRPVMAKAGVANFCI